MFIVGSLFHKNVFGYLKIPSITKCCKLVIELLKSTRNVHNQKKKISVSVTITLTLRQESEMKGTQRKWPVVDQNRSESEDSSGIFERKAN